MKETLKVSSSWVFLLENSQLDTELIFYWHLRRKSFFFWEAERSNERPHQPLGHNKRLCVCVCVCVCLHQVLFWGLRELKKVQLLSVDRPQVYAHPSAMIHTHTHSHTLGLTADEEIICRLYTLFLFLLFFVYNNTVINLQGFSESHLHHLLLLLLICFCVFVCKQKSIHQIQCDLHVCYMKRKKKKKYNSYLKTSLNRTREWATA